MAGMIPSRVRRKEKEFLRSVGPINQLPHPDSVCSECSASPILGPLYRCGVCSVGNPLNRDEKGECREKSFNLCSACWADPSVRDRHPRSHGFLKIPVPFKLLSGADAKSKGVKPRRIKDFPEGPIANQSLVTCDRNQYHGFEFSVVPAYSEEYQASLLTAKQGELEQALRLQKSWTLKADYQLSELASQIAEKKTGKLQTGIQSPQSFGGYSQRSTRAVQFSPLKMHPRDISVSGSVMAKYKDLEARPVEELQLRFAVLRLLNDRVAGLLPLIDWSRVAEGESLAFIFKQLRGIVFTQLKMGLFSRALEYTDRRSMGMGGSRIQLQLKRPKPSGADLQDLGPEREEEAAPIDEGLVFVQMAKAVMQHGPQELRTSQQPFSVQFAGEAGIDAGGVFRDAVSELCSELQSAKLPLLVPCPNAVNKVGYTLDKWIPNSSCSTPEHLRLFEFLGRLMGVAVRVSEPLQVDFPSLIWKKLVGIEPDLESIDKVAVTTLKMLSDKKALAKKEVDRRNFKEKMALTWSTHLSSAGRAQAVLRKGGDSVPVEWGERRAYCRAALETRLREFDLQMGAIRKGLVAVIPSRLLSLLTPAEFEGLVAGNPVIDVSLLKKQTRYSGCSPTDPHIRIFWKVMQGFTQEERSLFLRFVWGRSRLPVAANFTESFTVSVFRGAKPGHGDDEYLPISHTCFFSIDLPQYSTYDVMREKLLKVRAAGGFLTDCGRP